MRPYFAIIGDSFREALASRVLWLLLALITLLLVSLAPLGYQEQVTRGIDDEAVRDWPQLISRVQIEGAKTAPSPSRRILSLLDEPLRRRIVEFVAPAPEQIDGVKQLHRLVRDFRQALDELLVRRDFYDADAWRRVTLVSDEARKLTKIDEPKLSDDDVARRNRLLFESAYSELVAASPPTSVRFRYLTYDIGEPLPIRKADFASTLETVVGVVMNWFVGAIGVFVAILVTAPVIPQTFDPSVLNLLLSKPIRRSLLFLSKFVGGCAFIAVNAVYLSLGLWLLLGWRFDVWEPRLLLSIPIYLFMFAIYFSVSAVAGLVWRNAIVSVVVTVLFWLSCFVVGTSKAGVEQMVLSKLRITSLIPVDDSLITVNEMAATHQWNDRSSDWEEIFTPPGEEETQRRMAMALLPTAPPELRPIGPVYDRANERLVAAFRSFRNGQMVLNVGRRSEGWKNVRGANASLGTLAMLQEKDGRILTISSLGLHRLTGDPTFKPAPVKVFGFSLPLPDSGPFKPVGPETGLLIARPVDARINADDGRLAIYSRGGLALLSLDEQEKYRIEREKKLDGDASQSVVLAVGGQTLLIGRRDGRLSVHSATTLEAIRELTIEEDVPPRYISASPGGRYFAVVLHNGSLWIYDAESGLASKPAVVDQGDVSSAEFSAADRLLVAHHATRVSEYELPAVRLLRRRSPPMSLIETIYRYALEPIYWAFPKPGELDKTVQHLLTGKKTTEPGRGDDLSAARQTLHPWRPVVSSLVFMLVVLTFGCVYMERQEF